MKNKKIFRKIHFALIAILVLLLPAYTKNSWWNFNDTTRTTTPTTETPTYRITTPTTETSTYRTTTPTTETPTYRTTTTTTETSTSRTTTPTTETSTSRTTTPTSRTTTPTTETSTSRTTTLTTETSTAREDYSEPRETTTREDYSEPEETPAREDYSEPEETPTREDYSEPEETATTRKSYSSRTEEPPRKNPTLRYTTPEKRPVQEIQEEFTAITETRLRKRTESPIYNRDNDRINITKDTRILVVPDLPTAEEETRNLLRKNANLDENLIISPSSDTDGDGVSDVIEDQYFTDFTNPDSDGDGISDGDEILAYNSDPLKVEKIDTTPSINNLNGRTTGSLPLIKGRAKPNEKITITATQDNKNIITVCKTESDEQGIFVCQPEKELKNGDYSLFANSKREVQIKVEDEKNKQKIEAEVKKVPKTLTVLKNTQQFLNIFSNIIGTKMSEATFRSPAEKFFSSQAEVQKLVGQSDPNTNIMITWQSFTLNSVVLADASQGKFEAIIPRKLAKGYHKILVYAYNAKLNSISNPKLINFYVE